MFFWGMIGRTFLYQRVKASLCDMKEVVGRHQWLGILRDCFACIMAVVKVSTAKKQPGIPRWFFILNHYRDMGG